MDKGEILDSLNALLKQHLKEQKSDSMLCYKDPEELSTLLDLENETAAGNWSKVFFWIEHYLQYSVKTDNPGFVNRMWVGANLPSILGEMVAAVSNTSSCTYESAPVSTVMEQYMLNTMLQLVGFTHGEGQMTTGSSNANMLAMMAARNEYQEKVKTDGLFGSRELYAFASADAHYSMEKAANILGIGTRHLVKIPVNSKGEMDVVILQKKIQEMVDLGGLPFFVAATAGTTVRGAYDPIEEILDLRRRYAFWLHVDGAWGAAVLVSDALRERFMKGVEKVDSLTWDFHKMLGTSLMCNVFLINNRSRTLGKVCSAGDASYLFHNESDNSVRDLGAVSLQCGRRVDSLKWFLDWKFFGKEEFARRVEYSLQLCSYAEKKVQELDELELVLPRNSFNICFRYLGKGARNDELNLLIRKKLYQQGASLVGFAYQQKKPFLRLLLANHELTQNDIDRYLSDIVETGKSLEMELL